MRRLILFTYLLGAVTVAHAKVVPPKLLFLGYQQSPRSNDKKFGYVGPTLDEAILTELQKAFIFSTLPRSVWERTAADNHLYAPDFHTLSVAVNLGLITKQDIVVAGSFEVVDGKILVETSLYDGNKSVEAKRIKSSLPADARLFEGTEKAAKEIAAQAGSILPNKENWERRYAEIQTDALKLNSIALEGGFSLATYPVPLSSSLQSNTVLGISDIPFLFGGRLSYIRQRFLFGENWLFLLSGYYLQGNAPYSVQFGLARAELQQMGAAGGLGYHIDVSKKARLYTRILAQGGYSLNLLRMDYSAVFPRPVDPATQQPLDSQQFTYRAPYAELGFPIGITPLPAVAIEFVPRVQGFFMQNRYSVNLLFTLGAVISF